MDKTERRVITHLFAVKEMETVLDSPGLPRDLKCLVCKQWVNPMTLFVVNHDDVPVCSGCNLEKHKLYRVINVDCPCFKVIGFR